MDIHFKIIINRIIKTVGFLKMGCHGTFNLLLITVISSLCAEQFTHLLFLCVMSSVGFVWSVPYSWKRAHCVAKTSRHESDSFPTCPDISPPTLDVDFPPSSFHPVQSPHPRNQPDQSNHDAVSGLDAGGWTFDRWSRPSLKLEGRRE